MKKIGFVDYYLDEWHANEYPKMIAEATNANMQVCYAFGAIDSPNGGLTNKQWAVKNNVKLLATIEQVVEKSDYIIVLSPDNPEMHKKLSEKPLMSGKRVYIDKTFSNSSVEAEEMFALAEQHHTEMFTSSALFYADELKGIEKEKITRIISRGTGSLENYSIHQIEPVISLMGFYPKQVIFTGTHSQPSYIIEFENQKRAYIFHMEQIPFSMDIEYNAAKPTQFEIQSNYFGNFMKKLTEFFEHGIIPVPQEQTVAAIKTRETILKASQSPFEWINIGQKENCCGSSRA